MRHFSADDHTRWLHMTPHTLFTPQTRNNSMHLSLPPQLYVIRLVYSASEVIMKSVFSVKSISFLQILWNYKRVILVFEKKGGHNGRMSMY